MCGHGFIDMFKTPTDEIGLNAQVVPPQMTPLGYSEGDGVFRVLAWVVHAFIASKCSTTRSGWMNGALLNGKRGAGVDERQWYGARRKNARARRGGGVHGACQQVVGHRRTHECVLGTAYSATAVWMGSDGDGGQSERERENESQSCVSLTRSRRRGTITFPFRMYSRRRARHAGLRFFRARFVSSPIVGSRVPVFSAPTPPPRRIRAIPTRVLASDSNSHTYDNMMYDWWLPANEWQFLANRYIFLTLTQNTTGVVTNELYIPCW